MSDSDDLEALIRLAWNNGFDGLEQGFLSPFSVLKREFEHFVPLSVSSYILFSHSFIQALCKAKWGNKWDGYGEDPNEVYQNWEKVLIALAITPESERIAYLAEVFL